MDAIRQVVVGVNRYRAEDVPELRTRMNLIGSVPALQASAAHHYDAWERAVSEFAAGRLGQPPTRSYPLAIGRATLAVCRSAYDRWAERADADLTVYLDLALRALAAGFDPAQLTRCGMVRCSVDVTVSRPSAADATSSSRPRAPVSVALQPPWVIGAGHARAVRRLPEPGWPRRSGQLPDPASRLRRPGRLREYQQHRPRRAAVRLPRLRRLRLACAARPDDRRARRRHQRCVHRPGLAPAGGKYPAGQRARRWRWSGGWDSGGKASRPGT